MNTSMVEEGKSLVLYTSSCARNLFHSGRMVAELSVRNHDLFSFLSLWQPVPDSQIEEGRAVKGLDLQFRGP